MSASQSHLSAPQYGYDIVVATIQGSVNATLDQFIHSAAQPLVVMCYVNDGSGNPVPIDYQTLVTNAKGSDPFNVPANADPATDADLQNLAAAGFLAGFKAQIGLPPGVPLTQITDIMVLGANTNIVTYNLLCSTFAVVQYTPASGTTSAAWLSQSQPSGAPWIFTSQVNLEFSTADQANYSSLPPAVYAATNNMGAAEFSVQQLMFDLDTAALETSPAITGVQPNTNLYNCLQHDFINTYFTALQKSGLPLLNYTITQNGVDNSTLTISSQSLQVNPLLDASGNPVVNPTQQESDLYSLDYLCAVNGNTLAPPAQFTWNWIEISEESQYDGVIAVNGVTFSKWLGAQLQPALQTLCIIPECICGSGLAFGLGFAQDTTPQQYNVQTGQPASEQGFVPVLYSNYAKESKASGSEFVAFGSLKCVYSMSSGVSFSTNQVQVVTEVCAYIDFDVEGGHSRGKVALFQSTTTYTITVDAFGNLQVDNPTPQVEDASQPLDISIWSKIISVDQVTNDINQLVAQVKDCIGDYLVNYDNGIQQCIGSLKSFVFPGGQTFAFADVAFSQYQDLVAHITYVDPS